MQPTLTKGKNFFFIALFTVASVFAVKGLKKEIKLNKKNSSSYKPMEMSAVQEKKAFVIIVPSFNNEEYVEKNLESIFSQCYENYRVIYIDDCSTDKTYEKAMASISRFHGEEKTTLVKNPINRKALYNLYYAIHSARNDEIVVMLDGDDWFPNPYVLLELNRYYNDENVWMTYGQYITYPKYEKGTCRELFFNAIGKGKVRKNSFFDGNDSDWAFSHLRTFYAGIFKRIAMKDFLHKGEFFSSAWDLAVMFPMLEMAREHAVFIPDVLYVYNRDTPINDDKVRREEQLQLNKHIRSLKPYEPLTRHPKEEFFYDEHKGVDLLVFSEDRPMQLYAFLESFDKFASNFDQVHVFYRSMNEEFTAGYETIEELFKGRVTFHNLAETEKILKPYLLDLLTHRDSYYACFATDDLLLKDKVDAKEALAQLEKSGAYGFYFHLGLNIRGLPEHILPAEEETFLWPFEEGERDWNESHSLKMSLYRKKDIIDYLKKIRFKDFAEFKSKFRGGSDVAAVGICPQNSKVIEIPMLMTKVDTGEQVELYSPEELNVRFLEGFKIDIVPAETITPRTSTIEYYPRFLPRQ